jgi:hypothetical protein
VRLFPVQHFLVNVALRLCGAAMLAQTFDTPEAPATNPHVIILLADDSDRSDGSFNGNANIATPHVD